MNCHKPAIYDYEIGIAVCDYCFMMNERHNVFTEKCSHCNVADQEIVVPRIGEIIQNPTEKQINRIINWLHLIKISSESSYDIIKPIKVDNDVLEYYSYVENEILRVDLNKIPEIEVERRSVTTVKWSTDLKGLKNYLKEGRNMDLVKGKEYVRLVFFTGCSWDKNRFNPEDVTTKRNVRNSHFVNGLTLNIDSLLRCTRNDSLFIDQRKNSVYLIESITKFEIL